MFRSYIAYLKDNPQGYWFKRRLFGWGWVPATWQGWLVIGVSICLALVGGYIGERDDAPGLILLSVVFAVLLIFIFGYIKGEKPRWQWGIPKKYTRK